PVDRGGERTIVPLGRGGRCRSRRRPEGGRGLRPGVAFREAERPLVRLAGTLGRSARRTATGPGGGLESRRRGVGPSLRPVVAFAPVGGTPRPLARLAGPGGRTGADPAPYSRTPGAGPRPGRPSAGGAGAFWRGHRPGPGRRRDETGAGVGPAPARPGRSGH